MDISTLGIEAIPVITIIVYLVGELVKATPLNDKYVPVVCGIVGGILGVVAMNVMPEFPADDILTAIAVGIVSGLGATGVHQLFHQLLGKEE